MRTFLIHGGTIRLVVRAGCKYSNWSASFYSVGEVGHKTFSGMSTGMDRQELFKHLRMAISLKLNPKIKDVSKRVAGLPV